MTWIFSIWTLMFWAAPVASAAAGWLALDSGIIAKPVPLALWFLTALLLQFTSDMFSAAWIAGMAAQSTLAIYLIIRLKLGA